jgi:hypothetical protein
MHNAQHLHVIKDERGHLRVTSVQVGSEAINLPGAPLLRDYLSIMAGAGFHLPKGHKLPNGDTPAEGVSVSLLRAKEG